jgi:hypothetical protein
MIPLILCIISPSMKSLFDLPGGFHVRCDDFAFSNHIGLFPPG